jgi:hypothetical protein
LNLAVLSANLHCRNRRQRTGRAVSQQVAICNPITDSRAPNRSAAIGCKPAFKAEAQSGNVAGLATVANGWLRTTR